MQLTPALVSTVSTRCKPELLPVTCEQYTAMPGGINVNTSYIISGCSPLLCHCLCRQLYTGVLLLSENGMAVAESAAAVIAASPAALLCRVEGKPG